MLQRGGILTPWIVRPDEDPLWSNADWGTAKTLEAKWSAKGVSEDERRRLIPCAVWMSKHSGLKYSGLVMKRLKELQN
jgi:hypothetical protein